MKWLNETQPLWTDESFGLLFQLGCFSSLVPFLLGVGPGGILCRELLTLGIPPFGWSKLDQSDSTPGSGGRHICSVWLAANRGFILGWVGERDFYVRRGFIVGWQGVASVKGGNHFSSLAECLTFCEAEFNLCMWVPRFLWRVSDESMSFIDKLNNFREIEHSVAHRKVLQEKICWFHVDQLGSNNEGNVVQTHSLVSLVPQIRPEENEKKSHLVFGMLTLCWGSHWSSEHIWFQCLQRKDDTQTKDDKGIYQLW